jgi:aspartyl-tRNA(Asn)/glutamyl-tRNA(Gln) amidotransferase subunit A
VQKGLRSIREARAKIQSGSVTSSELVEVYLERASETNRSLNIFITLLQERAKRVAALRTREVRAGRVRGPLHGIPLALKDIFYIKGVRCTAGSKILAEFVPDFDATAVNLLERAGAVIIGTTNLHEFASGVTTVNPHYGATRNPWDTARIAGGSSGGSAAAVAADAALGSLGTDTSGSVRIPASLCGVYGLKPTYGRISKFGVVPLSPSLDHVGIMTRSAWDAGCILAALDRFDRRDPDSSRFSSDDFVRDAEKELDVDEFLLPPDYFLSPLEGAVKSCFWEFVRRLERMGIASKSSKIPSIGHVREAWAPVRFAEASAFHRDWLLKRPEDYGRDVLVLLREGLNVSAVEYLKARELCDVIRNEMIKALGGSILVSPVTPTVAPKIGQKRVRVADESFDVYSILSRFTFPFNVTGLPALSVPVGLSSSGLPVGVQLVGPPGSEGRLLHLASNYERRYGLNVRI